MFVIIAVGDNVDEDYIVHMSDIVIINNNNNNNSNNNNDNVVSSISKQ